MEWVWGAENGFDCFPPPIRKAAVKCSSGALPIALGARIPKPTDICQEHLGGAYLGSQLW